MATALSIYTDYSQERKSESLSFHQMFLRRQFIKKEIVGGMKSLFISRLFLQSVSRGTISFVSRHKWMVADSNRRHLGSIL